MGSPFRGVGYYGIRAVRTAARYVPEDFVLRVEAGLDEQTKARLARGVRVLQRLRRVDRLMTVVIFLGIGTVLAGLTVPFKLGFWTPSLGVFVMGLSVVAWLAALGCFLYMVGTSFAHRDDVHQVAAFYAAMQGSSLARDLA